jgi:hypothetical protein
MAKQSLKTRTTSVHVRIPGFNAEASLYSSPAAYGAIAGSGGTIGVVQPAYYSRQWQCYYCTGGACYQVPCHLIPLVQQAIE